MTALVAVVAVAAALLIGRPADARRIVRPAGAAIVVLTAGLLAPSTVQDSGSAAIYLLGVPVVAALLPLAAPRVGVAARVVDLLAGAVVGGWGLLLALGIGVAFLPAGLLYLAGAAVVPGDGRAPAGHRTDGVGRAR
ncbi:hypothetical protein [Pseudonocardia humida]|uniref:Uncharacterized protein n=1 Tax=Pseudonocardia humida TaxID=2800819 RepID=A0ABT1A7U4_9PSEU|nr:hypothetical protein [Pseudonocardia humida]MCO1659100.1 hypothetical protein [Pseudonocardia humida]